MIRNAVLLACVVAGVAGAAEAATVQFRIVERRGQSSWNPIAAQSAPLNDSILNFAVQARVVGGTSSESLGNFSFDITSNEAEGNGTLTTARICLADGSYVNDAALPPYTAANPNPFGNNAAIGTGGLSKVYSYLAGINANFNGLINTNGGSFSNNPAINEIGLVTGSPTGAALLAIFDSGGSGAPDTYPGSGSTAPVDALTAAAFLGAGENWVNVYNFNYVMSSTATRQVHFDIANHQAQIFSTFALANNTWGPGAPANAVTGAVGVDIEVIPAPAAGKSSSASAASWLPSPSHCLSARQHA